MATLSELDKQIAELEAQKKKLIQQEKEVALAKVKDAIAELNALGYNYSLTETGQAPTTTRTRRPGVKNDVLGAIKASSTGLDRQGVLSALGAHDDQKLTNSISNALSQLKKSGAISHDTETGTYSVS